MELEEIVRILREVWGVTDAEEVVNKWGRRAVEAALDRYPTVPKSIKSPSGFILSKITKSKELNLAPLNEDVKAEDDPCAIASVPPNIEEKAMACECGWVVRSGPQGFREQKLDLHLLGIPDLNEKKCPLYLSQR